MNELQKIIDDKNSDPRIKILVYNKQLTSGHNPTKKELLAVIVEVSVLKMDLTYWLHLKTGPHAI